MLNWSPSGAPVRPSLDWVYDPSGTLPSRDFFFSRTCKLVLVVLLKLSRFPFKLACGEEPGSEFASQGAFRSYQVWKDMVEHRKRVPILSSYGKSTGGLVEINQEKECRSFFPAQKSHRGSGRFHLGGKKNVGRDPQGRSLPKLTSKASPDWAASLQIKCL